MTAARVPGRATPPTRRRVRVGPRAGLALAAAAVVVAGCRGRGPADDERARAAPAAAALDAAGDVAATATAPPPTIVLDEVEVRLHAAAEGALASRELARELGRCLVDGHGLVALAEQVPAGRAPRHARLRVEVLAQPPPRGAGKVTVVMDAQLEWRRGDDAAPSATATGDASVGGGRVDVAVLAVAQRLRDAVCADLAARVAVWAADDLRPALASDDPATVHWALVLVAERGPSPGLAREVLPHLRGAPPVQAAAVTALVALGDPVAVPALTELTDLGDRTALTTIVEAVIALGGDDARDYLGVMASHRDPEIARHARDGLARLDRRAAAAAIR